MPKGVALQALRAWSFASVTSARFHDRIRLPGSFGFENQKDAQEHYLHCPHVWAPVAAATGHPVATSTSARTVSNLNAFGARNLAVVTNIYHTIRRVPRWRLSAEISKILESCGPNMCSLLVRVLLMFIIDKAPHDFPYSTS